MNIFQLNTRSLQFPITRGTIQPPDGGSGGNGGSGNGNTGGGGNGGTIIPPVDIITGNVIISASSSSGAGATTNYEIRQNHSLVSDPSKTVLLNGYYATINERPLPDALTMDALYFMERTVANNIHGIQAINDSRIQTAFSQNYAVHMWVYPIFNTASLTKPITLLTKGNATTYGEITLQILPDRRILFGTSNATLRSNNSIPEKKRTLVSAIRIGNVINIYLNATLNSQLNINASTPTTTNPLVIASGYGSNAAFAGMIENLIINTYINDASNDVSYMRSLVTFEPISHLYEFTKGVMTFNSFMNGQGRTEIAPANITKAKLYATQLGVQCGGFHHTLVDDISPNTFVYFAIAETNPIPNPPTSVQILQPTPLENRPTAYFKTYYFSPTATSSKVRLLNKSIRVESMGNVLEGVYKTILNEPLLFNNGSLMEYDTATGMYNYKPLTQSQADELLLRVDKAVSYNNISSNYYQFSLYDEIRSDVDTATNMNDNIYDTSSFAQSPMNSVRCKIKQYTFGEINSIQDFIGTTRQGTYSFTNIPPIVELPKTENRVGFRSVDSVANSQQPITVRSVPSSMSSSVSLGGDYQNVLYIYNAQSMNVNTALYSQSSLRLPSLPILEKTICLQNLFDVDQEIDLTDLILKNGISTPRYIIATVYITTPASIYNLTVVTNTFATVRIGNRDYTVNSLTPQHIPFHKSASVVELSVEFNFARVNNIVRFMVMTQ